MAPRCSELKGCSKRRSSAEQIKAEKACPPPAQKRTPSHPRSSTPPTSPASRLSSQPGEEDPSSPSSTAGEEDPSRPTSITAEREERDASRRIGSQCPPASTSPRSGRRKQASVSRGEAGRGTNAGAVAERRDWPTTVFAPACTLRPASTCGPGWSPTSSLSTRPREHSKEFRRGPLPRSTTITVVVRHPIAARRAVYRLPHLLHLKQVNEDLVLEQVHHLRNHLLRRHPQVVIHIFLHRCRWLDDLVSTLERADAAPQGSAIEEGIVWGRPAPGATTSCDWTAGTRGRVRAETPAVAPASSATGATPAARVETTAATASAGAAGQQPKHAPHVEKEQPRPSVPTPWPPPPATASPPARVAPAGPRQADGHQGSRNAPQQEPQQRAAGQLKHRPESSCGRSCRTDIAGRGARGRRLFFFLPTRFQAPSASTESTPVGAAAGCTTTEAICRTGGARSTCLSTEFLTGGLPLRSTSQYDRPESLLSEDGLASLQRRSMVEGRGLAVGSTGSREGRREREKRRLGGRAEGREVADGAGVAFVGEVDAGAGVAAAWKP
ncbi:hypothetical protein BRADI_2g33660v3 [Brachypodium distachyon]|uniref:Uncharacterized protein n=1 Tax=Brachypodium distachyon TaxID=15368 RepID=A0A2K2DBM2_BRADI|nr:hypothetical protein BRADI_2g33660v3 [Brachypodium distachyon]